MSDESFSLAEAQLVSLFLESLIFGAFTVLYVLAIWILLYREKRRVTRLSKVLCATISMMWLLSLAHLGIDVARAIIGFITHGSTQDGTTAFFATLSEPTLVAKDAIYITMTLIADSFITYRLWIVWNCVWWVVVIPIMLLIATAITGYGSVTNIGLVKGQGAIFADNLQPWIRSFFSISLTTNILATVLIAGRILWLNRQVQHFRAVGASTSHWDVAETLVQSAAIYSFALASLLGTYLAGSNAQYVCLDAIQPTIGFVFTLIIIRLGLGNTLSQGNKVADTHTGGPIQTIGGTEYPLRPVAINVSVAQASDRPSLEMFNNKRDVERGSARHA